MTMNPLLPTDTSILDALSIKEVSVLIKRLRALPLDLEHKEIKSLLSSLKQSKFINVSSRPFHGFIVNNIVLKKADDSFERQPRQTEKSDGQHSKDLRYEARFFWPSDYAPEVYDFNDLLFNEKNYKYTSINEKYILTEGNLNIKIRKNELQLKIFERQMNHIAQFQGKKKLIFPLHAKKLKGFFPRNKLPDSLIFKTFDEFFFIFSHYFEAMCVSVVKERYTRKIQKHIKIELAVIKTLHKEWKTLCIESDQIEEVQALCILIEKKNALPLSYNTFLRNQL